MHNLRAVRYRLKQTKMKWTTVEGEPVTAICRLCGHCYVLTGIQLLGYGIQSFLHLRTISKCTYIKSKYLIAWRQMTGCNTKQSGLLCMFLVTVDARSPCNCKYGTIGMNTTRNSTPDLGVRDWTILHWQHPLHCVDLITKATNLLRFTQLFFSLFPLASQGSAGIMQLTCILKHLVADNIYSWQKGERLCERSTKRFFFKCDQRFKVCPGFLHVYTNEHDVSPENNWCITLYV